MEITTPGQIKMKLNEITFEVLDKTPNPVFQKSEDQE